ncbi:MAG: putative bifunctional diguanylate cyclase/phosphodiesterase [bacterium]
MENIESILENSPLAILKIETKKLVPVDALGDINKILGISKNELINNPEIFQKSILPSIIKEVFQAKIYGPREKNIFSKVINVWVEDSIKKLKISVCCLKNFILLFLVDVTNEYELIDKYKYQNDFLNSLLSSIPQGIVIVNSNNLVVKKYKYNYQLKEVCEVMGIREGISLYETFPSEKLNLIKYNVDYVSKVGGYKNVLFEIKVGEIKKTLQLSFSKVSKSDVLIVVNDISELVELKEKYEYLSLHDPLTGLPNRRYVTDQLKQFVIQASRHGRKIGVLFIDIDNFKDINDNYGHHIGDKLLKEVSQRILYSLRPGDVVGRMAGDEFIVILDDIAKPEDVQLVCNKILSNLEKIEIDDILMDITLSIGISIYPEDTENVDDLIKFADMAMYKSKEKGKNTFEFYSKEMAQRFKYRIEMINKIQNAIKNSSFTVFYQPIIDIKDLQGQTEEEIKQEIVSKGLIIGLEALIRWFENGKIIPPLEFIPLAEETNLIVPIGRIVLDLSTKQISKFEKKLFINVSAKEFEYPLYFEQLVKILEKNSFNPRFLSIEITEGIVIKNIDKFLDIASDLRKLGIEICIDDFGVGYSSLSSLINIPANIIKIDRSFIAQITKDEKVRRIVKGIIDISKILGFKVVAEGIETFEQLKIVKEYGCDYAQGFFFFKPAPIEEIEKFL